MPNKSGAPTIKRRKSSMDLFGTATSGNDAKPVRCAIKIRALLVGLHPLSGGSGG